MIGKLLGKAVGTVLAAPAVIAKEAEEAIDAVERTIDRAYDPKPRGTHFHYANDRAIECHNPRCRSGSADIH